MQNRSSLPIVPDDKHLPAAFPVTAQSYTQRYRAEPSLHTHGCMELGLCLSGSGGLFIDGSICAFEPGSIQIIQRGSVHDSHILMSGPDEPPGEWRYIFADLDALGMLPARPCSFTVMHGGLRALFDLLYDELTQRPEGWQAQARRLLEAFVCMADRCAPDVRPLPDGRQGRQMAEVLHYIALHPAADLSVEALARLCSLSVSHFRKLFVRHVGVGPKEYVLRLRLSLAAHMLRVTQRPILSISEEVGFHSLSSFNRQFKHLYACSPRHYRQG